MNELIKKNKTFIILVVVAVIVLTVACVVCFSINGFKQDDFTLSITSVKIEGNKVTVTAQLKNNSLRNGWISSSGLIHMEYHDENGMPDNWGVASIYILNWMRCKQTVIRTVTFELNEKGKYTIEAFSSFSCNGDKDDFHYKAQKVIEIN